MALIEKLTAIADAVREKTGGDQPLTLDEIRDEIAAIATESAKPYIDSSRLGMAYFCYGGQNLDIVTDPNFDGFGAENIEYLFFQTRMFDLPAMHLVFPNAKNAQYMFASLGKNLTIEYGADLSHVVVDLPMVEDANHMFAGTYMSLFYYSPIMFGLAIILLIFVKHGEAVPQEIIDKIEEENAD